MDQVILGMNTKTKKKTVAKELPARAPETTIPLGALQSLVGLSETLKKMRPKGDRHGGAAAPKIILTSSGMELRFDGTEQAQETAHDAAGLSAVLKRVAQLEQGLEPLLKKTARAQQSPGITPERLAGIEEELKALRQSTAALQEAVAKNSRSIEKTLESHSAAISSVRAALAQNEELVEGIVETLQMLNGVSEEPAEEPLVAAS
jgi:hypothetical protein